MLVEAQIKEKVLKTVFSLMRNKDKSVCGTERFDELGFDSLDMFEFILKVEDVFMIEITDEEATECISIPMVVACVQKKLIKE